MEVFDDEWIAAASAALAQLPEVDGASAVVDCVVAGGPSGKVTIGVVVDDGRVTAMQTGKSTDPDLVISFKYDVALQLLNGEMSSDAGFMNGAIKVEGAHARWMLDLRPVRLAAIEALAPVMADSIS